MANKLFKSLFAVVMTLGAALGFVACEEQGDDVVANPTVEVSTKSLNFPMEEGSESVNITANSDWKVECDADWVTITPAHGTGDATITVAVAMNDTDDVRETTVKVIALHKTYGAWDTKKIAVKQSASEDVPVTEELLYGDNFDGKEATKEYGSGTSWPYIDQFPEFANPEGPAAANVTYTGSKVSVRANQQSNQSNYSNYAGSGSNNIFFGDGGYFVVNNIAPLSADEKNYKITFGVQKYAGNDGDSSFKNTDFLLYISKDGEKWAPVEYTIADLVEGKYNVATADFTLAAATDKLYIKFVAKVASVLRFDDLKFFTGNGGKTVDLDNIEAPQPSEAKKVTV
ncbi:MAG: BACON domain-containing protein, partial [Alistipes sp.]|nr:BACON domain-containing protein [Alistipes sp.]